MFKFIRNLFRKQVPSRLPGSKPEDRWVADFSSMEASGFERIDEERYRASVDNGSLVLNLLKGNLFAWTDSGTFSYSDVSIEAEIDMGASGPKRAAGLIVRKADERSFVYVLVSSDGDVRLDAVFNGEPRTLVPWISCPWIGDADSIVLSVVARGSRFIVMVNGRFALEAEDDALEAGNFAFAAQSYEGPADFRLISLCVESRPVEVEVDYLRYARVVEADVDQRRRLIEGMLALGFYVPALVQLRRIPSDAQGAARDRFMEAECLLRLELLDEAAAAIDACLAADPSMNEAVEERYNLLYLRGRYLDLRDDLEADSGRLAGSPRLQNLLGHSYFNMGSWESAAEAYGQARALDPAMPIYARNHAMALEKSGDLSAASGAWLAAAKGFYAQEAWDDAADCSRRLRELGFDKSALDSIDGLVAYGRGDEIVAESILAKLFKKKKADAPAAYIHGLLVSKKGRRAEAVEAFRQAAEMEPDVAIYRYRLAESLFLSGMDCADDIRAALEAAPGDGWSLNLAGQAAIAAGDAASASGYFKRAVAALPDEPSVIVNLSHALTLLDRFDDATTVLGDWPGRSASAANQLGNVLSSTGDLPAAADAYRKACALGAGEPELPNFRTNLASVLIALGEYAEAEDELRRSLEAREDARTLSLMGDVATTIGDMSRAELSYRAALEHAPEDPNILRRLADHYMSRRRFEKAGKIAEGLDALHPEEAASIRSAIKAATTDTISCASCDRIWEVPKPCPKAARASLRGEPPDDSPAGSCPECGKTYCVACRKESVEDGRFTCPDCAAKLNVNDDRIRWLVVERIKAHEGA